MFRTLAGVRFLVLIAPLILIGAWAFSYLRACWNAVLAPGVPISVKFKTPGGELTFNAASYSFHPRTGSLLLNGPELRDPDDRPIVLADRVNVDGIDLFEPSQIALKVRAFNVKGTLVRQQNGKLDLQSFLPTSNGKGRPTPYEVAIDHAEVTFVDQRGPNTWRQTATLDDLSVAGLGGHWLAGGRFQLEGAGPGDVALRHETDGRLSVRANVRQVELAALGRHFAADLPASNPVRSLTVASLKVNGPVDVEYAPQAPIKTAFGGTVEGQSVRFTGYSANTVRFQGYVTEGGLTGDIAANAQGSQVKWTGGMTWATGKFRLAGQTQASARSLANLPPPVVKYLPAHLSGENVAFRGQVTYDPVAGPSVDGIATARQVQYEQDLAENASAEVRVTGTQVWTRLAHATSHGAHVSGELALDWKTKGWTGAIQGGNITLAALRQRFPKVNIKGTPTGELSAYALLTGSYTHPVIDFRVAGAGSYTEADLPKPVSLDRILAQGEYKDGAIDLRRFRARTPAGALLALGTIGIDDGKLDVTVDGRGLEIGDFTDQASGLGSLSGALAGTLQHPRFIGQVEGYDLAYKGDTVSLLTAMIVADTKAITASAVDLVLGSSQVAGHAALDLSTHGISGEFESKAFQIEDLLGENYAGLVDARTTELSGTLDDPKIAFELTSKQVLAQEQPIENLVVRGSLVGQTVTLSGLTASTAGGSISATGEYDLDKKIGHANATASGLDLASLFPATQRTNNTAATGLVNGKANVRFTDQGLTSVLASGGMKGARINGTDLGDGIWNVSGDGHKLNGSAQVSFGTRFLALENATYDVDHATLEGDALVNNLTLQSLYQSAKPYLQTSKDKGVDRLAYLDGNIQVKAHLSGPVANPDITVSTFETDALSYNGVLFGTVTGTASRQAGKWDIGGVHLVDGATYADISGSIDEKGQTKLDGELNNFDLSKLADAMPTLGALSGSVSTSFLATGDSSHPIIRASLNAETGESKGKRVDFGADLNDITISDKGIDAAGALTYRGFHAQVTAHVPFAYPFTIPANEEVTATLTLNQRPLSDLAPYSQNIDPTRAQGVLNGSLALTGRKDALHLTGGLNLRAGRLGFRVLDPTSKPTAPRYDPFATELKELVLSLGIEDETITTDIAAQSSQGGSIDGKLSTKFSALNDLLDGKPLGDLDTWLTSPLSGNVSLTGLVFKESNRLLSSSVSLAGNLTVGGTLGTPGIGGNVGISNLVTTVPNFTSQPGTSTPPLVDPQFNIAFKFDNPGHINLSLASIDLTGQGHIGGSVSAPDSSASLGVVRGDLRLPGGKVSLEPGGTVRPSYQADGAGGSQTRVLVDLPASAHVTAVRNGDIAERYDIHLDVVGDLLLPDSVTFNATSDPPDLNQDQILALLGRTDLLSALGGGTSYAQGEKQFESAAIGYALPSLFDPITQRLAASLNLDYISLEYNALAQTSLLAAKTLGHGFSIQARRQVSEPTPGIPLSYDYRLVYQLPTRSTLVRRFSFFLGKDEWTQWKIGFQYGQRL